MQFAMFSSPQKDHRILIGTILPFSLFFVIKTVKKRLFPIPHLPPGSLGWPFIGETLDYRRTGFAGEPDRFVRERMEKHNPLAFKTSLFGETLAVLCGTAGNKFLFSNENKLVKLWWTGAVKKLLKSGLVNVVGDEAKRMRKFVC